MSVTRFVSTWLVCSVLVALASGVTAQTREGLTIERITSPPYLSGTSPSSPTWSPDSSRVAFLWNADAQSFRDLWVVAAPDGEAERLTELGDDESNRQRSPGGIGSSVWTPEGDAIVFSFAGQLHRVAIDDGRVEPLRVMGAYALAFSPDGRFLSYIRNGDLWLWNQQTNDATQLTRVAKPKIGNSPRNTCCGPGFSRPDVEVSHYRWSPDSAHIALHIDDRSRVRRILIPNYLGEETAANPVRRDYPGDNDHLRELAIYSVSTGRLRRLDLAESGDRGIASYRWSPDSNHLLIDRFPQDAEDRWIYVASADDGALEEIWHDHRATRTTQMWNSVWQSDSQGIVFITDDDGRHHLYSLRLGENDAEQLTSGDWSVVGESGRAYLAASRPERQIYFVANRESVYERHVYRIGENGGSVEPLTKLAGIHHPVVSPDGSKLALLHSNDTTPTELYLLDAKNGGDEHRVTRSPPAEFADYAWVAPRYVTFPSHVDGVTLHGRLLEPPNLDRSKKHPVILGPVYPNTARNRWGDRQEWRGLYNLVQQHLVLEKGYIVFQVDVRGSVGHGRAFREKLIRDYGGIDIEDLHSGVQYLSSLDYVDSEHIGLWGSSYGGLMTAMSLFKKPGLYAAGVAAAPATNVHHAMTGQVNVAGKPSSHADVYTKTSAVSFAENLEDHLMILHGMQDSIVLFKDSVTLAEKLMEAGKDFELVVIPSAVHEWSARDANARYGLKRLIGHFDRHLRGAR